MCFYQGLQDIGSVNGGSILLPKDNSKKYPVLYLIHGTGGFDEWARSDKGNIFENMNNLVENEGATPCVVVMPKITGYSKIKNEDIKSLEKSELQSWNPFFNAFDIEGLVNYIDSTYSSYVDTEGQGKRRAIGGFSMGATAAIYHAVHNPCMFCHLGAVSVSSITSNFIKSDEFKFCNCPCSDSILYIGYGDGEDKKFINADNYCINSFNKNGYQVTSEKNEGTGHGFATFNPLLGHFISKIFKDGSGVVKKK